MKNSATFKKDFIMNTLFKVNLSKEHKLVHKRSLKKTICYIVFLTIILSSPVQAGVFNNLYNFAVNTVELFYDTFVAKPDKNELIPSIDRRPVLVTPYRIEVLPSTNFERRKNTYDDKIGLDYILTDITAFYYFFGHVFKTKRDNFQYLIEHDRKNVEAMLSNALILTEYVEHCESKSSVIDRAWFFIVSFFSSKKHICLDFDYYAVSDLSEDLQRFRGWLRTLNQYATSNLPSIDDKTREMEKINRMVEAHEIDKIHKHIQFDSLVTEELLDILKRYHHLAKRVTKRLSETDHLLKHITHHNPKKNSPTYNRLKHHMQEHNKDYLINHNNEYLLDKGTYDHWHSNLYVVIESIKQSRPYENLSPLLRTAEVVKEHSSKMRIPGQWFFDFEKITNRYPIKSISDGYSLEKITRDMHNNLFQNYEKQSVFGLSIGSQSIKDLGMSIDEISAHIRNKYYVEKDTNKFHLNNIFSSVEKRGITPNHKQKLNNGNNLHSVFANHLLIEKTEENESAEKRFLFEVVRESSLEIQIFGAEPQASIDYVLNHKSGKKLDSRAISIDFKGASEVIRLQTLKKGQYELFFSSQRMANYQVSVRVPEHKKDHGFFPLKVETNKESGLNFVNNNQKLIHDSENFVDGHKYSLHYNIDDKQGYPQYLIYNHDISSFGAN